MSLQIKDIKKGDKFCEFNGYHLAVRLIALDDAKNEDGFWSVSVKKIGTDESFNLSIPIING